MFEAKKIIISAVLFVIVTLLLLFSSFLPNLASFVSGLSGEFAYLGVIILLAFFGLYFKMITKKTLLLGVVLLALAFIGGYFVSNH